MELRKEYQEIVERERNAMGAVIGGNTHNAFINLAAACQALADRPMKELTNAEIDAIYRDHMGHEAGHYNPFERQAGRDIIAAFLAKQREPEVVKFRAARSKDGNRVQMIGATAELNDKWEWLEPAQEFEVKLP